MKNEISLLLGMFIGMALTICVTVATEHDTRQLTEKDLMVVFENGYTSGRLREITGVNNYSKDSAFVSNVWFND
jgi:hypothetical protein